MSVLTLTDDQQAAYDDFVAFIMNPKEQIFVLEGYAGTGKSTLVNQLIANLPATLDTVKLITQKDAVDWEILLTATTNKACEALAAITKETVNTIQSVLKLRVSTNYEDRTTSLVPRVESFVLQDKILFIDEASFIDRNLLEMIFERTVNCKLVFIGDPAQLAPPKTAHTPVFNAGFRTARLDKVIRQAEGNQIIELATAFRETVNGNGWVQCVPNGSEVIRLDRSDFEQTILQEMDRPDWANADSKVLAYTNRTVVQYNQMIRSHVRGAPALHVGDDAICNSYISKGKNTVKTDQLVKVTRIDPAVQFDVAGWDVEVDERLSAFLPACLQEKKKRLAEARAARDWSTVRSIESGWIDLRAAYACTINKSQGSTYNRVFIDLDDLKTCRNPNTLARLMYVAVSRARHQVFLTGDLV